LFTEAVNGPDADFDVNLQFATYKEVEPFDEDGNGVFIGNDKA
jgi:hypothetical protein